MFGSDNVCVSCGHASRVYYVVAGEYHCGTCFDMMKAGEQCELCKRRKMTIRVITVVREEEEALT
jgi:recombinational DNA repair protein RecR